MPRRDTRHGGRGVLVLGGTEGARALAAALHAARIAVTTSLAGRVQAPARPAGRVRIGHFGGASGLAAWLREHAVGAVVDATHPFAAAMAGHAAQACGETGVPLARLERPGWLALPGDDWRRVPDLPAAAAQVDGLGQRALLATGRGGLEAFAPVRAWCLVRAIDAPAPPLPRRHAVVLDRGPFSLEGERALLERHAIDLVVARDAGGKASAAKLAAARERGIPVLMVDRPPRPAPAARPASVPAAVAWVDRALAGGAAEPVAPGPPSARVGS